MSYAMYLRKSRAEELAALESVEDVLERHYTALKELAEKQHITVDGKDIFKEVVSGESIYTRPEMLKLLQAVQAGVYDAVLCMDIDRLGRGGMHDQGVILDAFKNSDTLIITPDKTYDLNDESDEELTEFKTFMARREYKMIRKRMRRGLMQTIADGGYVANAPYGYRRCTVNKMPSLEIVEDEAKFVRLMFERYSQGIGMTSIANELKALGSKPRRSNEWNRTSIRHILSNPTFIGKVVWNRKQHIRKGTKGNSKDIVKYNPEDKWIITNGLHPPIVSEELFEKVQKIRKERYIPSKRTENVANPLAGLIKCSQCGMNMQRAPFRKGGTYLLCNTRGCCAAAKFEYVETSLLDSLQDILAQLKIEQHNFKKPDIAQDELLLQSVESDIIRLENRIPKLYEFLEDGTYDRSTFKTRFEAIERERKGLIQKQEELKKKIELAKNKDKKRLIDTLENVLLLYPSQNANQKNILLKSVISKVEYTKFKKTAPHDFKLSITLRET